MKQVTIKNITQVEVENFELNSAFTYSGKPVTQTFDIAFGCNYSDGSSDAECRDIKAPLADVEGFFQAAAFGSEAQTFEQFLSEATFFEQLRFFGLYVKNRLESAQIKRLGRGIVKNIELITAA